MARYLERSEDRATRLIRRRYIEDASYEEMAAEEHTTCSNMRTLISRAIRALKQALIDAYEGAERLEEEVKEGAVARRQSLGRRGEPRASQSVGMKPVVSPQKRTANPP